MTASIGLDWLVTALAAVAAVFQIATLRSTDEGWRLLRSGRMLLAAGWTLGAIRLGYIMVDTGDLPLPLVTQIWILLLEVGSIFVQSHWIHGAAEQSLRNQDDMLKAQTSEAARLRVMARIEAERLTAKAKIAADALIAAAADHAKTLIAEAEEAVKRLKRGDAQRNE